MRTRCTVLVLSFLLFGFDALALAFHAGKPEAALYGLMASLAAGLFMAAALAFSPRP